MQGKALGGMILVLVAMIMIGLALFMPWYVVKMEMSAMGMSLDAETEYYLDHAEVSGMGMSEEMSYDNESIEDFNFIKTFQFTQILAILGVIGCIIGLIGAALVVVEKISSKVGAVLVLIAVILSLMAPFYLMFALPAAYKEDFEESGEDGAEIAGISEGMGENFFGSEKQETGEEPFSMSLEVTWGGSSGWFLALFAMIMCIIGMIFVAISKPVPKPAYPAQPAPITAYTYPVAQPPQAYAPQPVAPTPRSQPPPQVPPPVSRPPPPPPRAPTTPQAPPPPPPPQASACPFCRNPISPGNTFCPTCGRRIR